MDTSETDLQKCIKEDYEEVFNEKEKSTMVKYLSANLDAKNIGILLMFATGIRVGDDHVIIRLKLDKPSKYAGLS